MNIKWYAFSFQLKRTNMLWEDNLKNSEIYLSLNNRQQDAISLPNKHALILAGAGTGKTKTLIARIQMLLEF